MVVYTKTIPIKEVAKLFAAGYFRSFVPKRCRYGIVVEFHLGDRLDTMGQNHSSSECLHLEVDMQQD